MQYNPRLTELIDRLNPPQREAVTTVQGPELVIAGAGSGKTSVLTARIALLMEHGVAPETILALTFTKKAAEEMKSRIIDLEGDAARRLRMGTFHSVFITFLRPYAHYLGFKQNFTILDEEDSMSCLKRCIKAVVFADRPEEEAMTEEQAKYYKALEKIYDPKIIRNVISSAKNRLVTADAYAADPRLVMADTRHGRPLLYKIFLEYRNACFRSSAMDFDDILLHTDILMHSYPDVSRAIASQFAYILVDEYQDTNMAQYSILSRLTACNKNICVVGDDSQSIYAFRGAVIENIFRFRSEFPGTKVVRLEQNYRSTQTIVNAANRLISHNEGRIPKKCFSRSERGSAIKVHECENERHEADFIATVIRNKMKYEGMDYRDFAVLYRTNSQSRALEDSLIRKGIPYVIYSGVSFFERMEVKDLLAYFKLAVNPDDDESFLRVVNKPTRGVGPAAVNKIAQLAASMNVSMWKAINSFEIYSAGLSRKAYLGLDEFKTKIATFCEYAETMTAYDAVYAISSDVDFYNEYRNNPSDESQQRAENIRELVDSVKYYDEDVLQRNRDLAEEMQEKSTLTGYLQNVMLLSNADSNPDNDNKVSLMTVHCAKGLEFGCVFVAGVEQKLFPIEIDGDQRELEEERRLFYVAVTRAEKHLFLTHARARMKFGKKAKSYPSRFIEELLTDKIEGEQ